MTGGGDTSADITFPVGYYRFHRRQFYNFLLNRWHALGYARREDMARAGRRIRSFADWRREMLQLADEALADGRLVNAAFYTRAAEFLVRSGDPEKLALYDRFAERFAAAFAGAPLERHHVPYPGAPLPVVRLAAEPGPPRGTIILHGGFDSFIEEWYSMMRAFARRGYTVIGFEGPGQGAALRRGGLPLIIEWEKPVGAVLDQFDLDGCTLVGLSMGGWLALRAAAFEPRVRRVIASGHAMDYMRCMPEPLRRLHLWCLAHCRGFMERMAVLKFEGREGVAPWAVDHLKFITRRPKILDALGIYVDMNAENLHAERVRQDVLIMAGREDHLVPFRMHGRQMRALTGARSVTERVFTRADQAPHHCQTGNIGLAVDVMTEWLARISANHDKS